MKDDYGLSAINEQRFPPFPPPTTPRPADPPKGQRPIEVSEKDLKKGNGEDDLDELACRERSGSVDSKNLLDIFLYLLLRDEVPPGRVESMVTDALKCDEAWFTNGWLADYAKDIRIRLTEGGPKATGETK